MGRDINIFGLYDELIIYILTFANLTDADVRHFLMCNYYFYYSLKAKLDEMYWRQRFENRVKEETYPGTLSIARHYMQIDAATQTQAVHQTSTAYPQFFAGMQKSQALSCFLVEKNALMAGFKKECIDLLQAHQPDLDAVHGTVNPFNDPYFVEFIYTQWHEFVKRPLRWRMGETPVPPRIDTLEDKHVKNNPQVPYIGCGVIEDTERLLIARISRKHKTINLPGEIKVDVIFKRMGVRSRLATTTSFLEMELHVTQGCNEQLEGIKRVIFDFSTQHVNLFSALPMHARFLWHYHVTLNPVYMLSAFATAGLAATGIDYLRAMMHSQYKGEVLGLDQENLLDHGQTPLLRNAQGEVLDREKPVEIEIDNPDVSDWSLLRLGSPFNAIQRTLSELFLVIGHLFTLHAGMDQKIDVYRTLLTIFHYRNYPEDVAIYLAETGSILTAYPILMDECNIHMEAHLLTVKALMSCGAPMMAFDETEEDADALNVLLQDDYLNINLLKRIAAMQQEVLEDEDYKNYIGAARVTAMLTELQQIELLGQVTPAMPLTQVMMMVMQNNNANAINLPNNPFQPLLQQQLQLDLQQENAIEDTIPALELVEEEPVGQVDNTEAAQGVKRTRDAVSDAENGDAEVYTPVAQRARR